MDQNYKGLANLGATCYMNSLLQTLYMTPEFRQAIYQWKYNQRLHPEKQKSILYQLQKLFGKLDKLFPGQISTKELIKSFDWEDQEAQMQQDIQQFNRVLFEALQKSLMSRKKGQNDGRSHFVRQLYQGEMVHYTLCKQCQNQSQRQQTFQDVIVTVKNPYEKIYNSSLDLGIQRYMKPEILDQNNLYGCQICNKKVQAQRGVRFLKMPKLLNIILRRFDFDYFTFQRIKVNDRVQFPYILNFNRYMQGYDQIPQKLNEDSSAYFKTEPPKKNFPTSTTTKAKKVTKKPLVTNVAGKKTTKPSANTKSFLQQMRRKKMMSQQQNDDMIYLSGTATLENNRDSQLTMTSNKQIQIKSKTSQKQVKSAEYDVLTESKSEKQAAKCQQQKKQTVSLQNQKVQQASHKNILPPPPPILDLPPPTISQPFSKTTADNNQTIEQQLQKRIQEKQKLQSQKKQKLKQLSEKNKTLIKQYLKEGPLVYELYSVLVHNGSATHGHYYSYIKSFQNQNWYCFNDQRVSDVNVQEIEKSFGGIGGSNAYALYYRLVDSDRQNQNRPTIPNYIDSLIQEQIERYNTRQHQKIENLENVLILKIHYQLYVRQLQIHKTSSLTLCLEKARQIFDVSQQAIRLKNSRLRIYNPVSDTKLETFTGRQNLSLQELKIGSFRSLILQTKKDDQIFQQFIEGKINLRIVLWQIDGQNLKSLQQNYLKLHKVSVTKNSKMIDVQKQILKKRRQILHQNGINQIKDQICIVKRHQNDQYSYHQVINMPDYLQKTLDQLMVIDNQILFIEEDSNQLRWPIQFQNQIHRINIRYNHPDTGKIQAILTDSRKTIGELKQILCSLIDYDSEDIIMRSGSNKSGLELKILSMTMKEAKFITGKMLHLEKGIPAKQGQIRIQLFLAQDASKDLYNRLHEFEFIADVPVHKQWKASDVKEVFIKIFKKYKNIQLEKEQFRIREKVCDKIGKIYRERPMKQQQLIQKRQIAIQLKPDTIDLKQFAVYVRVWNPEQWTLSETMQIYVTKTTSMLEFGSLLFQKCKQISLQNMQVCRILSINKFNILDLCDMEYFNLTDASVAAEPLFVNADGLLFIFKDKNKQPRMLTKQQQMKFGGQIKNLTIKAKRNTTRNYVPKKEKGVTIRVTQNKEEQMQEQQPNNNNKQ